MAAIANNNNNKPWSANSEKQCKGERWSKPEGYPTGIYVRNSLCTVGQDATNSDVVELVTMEKNHLKFYICGPTVYALSHLGHARAYLTFDIVRRVLEDYFGLDVTVVMNITDVDDKIIKRGREGYLYEKFCTENSINENGGSNGKFEEAMKILQQVGEHTLNAATKKFDGAETDEERALYQKRIDEAREIISSINDLASANSASGTSLKDLVPSIKSQIGEYLDFVHGKDVRDKKIFDALAKANEKAYFEDMENLGIRPPAVITRVSEYVPEIVDFTQRIIDNGYGYESNGSVYFDTGAFKAAGHVYRKLVPPAENDTGAKKDLELLQEGEGALSKGTSEKRNEYDFALWKASKPGEPTWDSPWGPGRPGWHIECSAMGLSVFGDGNMDMHAGGIDLRFPHHDNELAQNEACFCHHQSVNYFLHAGHLHIDGLKMSKSLKNFTTIRSSLETSTANQIRMLFLLNAWDKGMNFSNDQFEQAVTLEKRFSDYFQNIKVYLRGQEAGTPKKWTGGSNPLELNLWQAYTQVMKNVRKHLQNNIDTNSAINELLGLVGKVNTYLSQVKDAAQGYLLLTISQYIMRILKCFGLTDDSFDNWMIGSTLGNASKLGNGLGKAVKKNGGDGSNNGGAMDREEVLTPFLNILSSFRDSIRDAASKGTDKQALFSLCDQVRKQLLEKGVKLEDRTGQSTGIKFGDAAAMKEEEDRKIQAAEEKRKKKEAAKLKREQEAAAKLAQAKIPPNELFKTLHGKEYSQFDDEGMPTHDAKGEPLAKSKLKKLKKKYAAQAKAYEKYLKSQQA
jgi:cysteinyl-tRNA synthetase